jgi:hypothetical protein
MSLCILVSHPAAYPFEKLPSPTAARDGFRCHFKQPIVSRYLSEQLRRKFSLYKQVADSRTDPQASIPIEPLERPWKPILKQPPDIIRQLVSACCYMN